MLILETLQDQVHIFQGTYFETSQRHQLRKMCHFIHKNLYILLNLYFDILIL